MPKYSQGIYTVKHPEKYCGPNLSRVTYRSSWEHTFLLFLDADNRPNIHKWSSECISIPYRHPFLNKIKMYVPDFFVVWMDNSGKQNAAIFEIKPIKENPWINPNGKYPAKLQAIRFINLAKWSAAIAYCAKLGITFRVVTENDLFAYTRQN